MAVNPTEGGTTSPAVGAYPGYTAGTSVDITATATPNTGWYFVDWTGDVANSGSATTTVTMNANKTVTANFNEEGEPVTHTLTIDYVYAGDGTAAPTYTAGLSYGDPYSVLSHVITVATP